jgi:hypothetical protein
MAIETQLPADADKHLSGRAAKEFGDAISKYADDLLKETNRLEATAKSTGGDPEITSNMVKDADLLLRRGWVRPKKKRSLVAAQITAAVGGFITGLLTDGERLKEPGMLVLFVVVLAITITATVISVMGE